MKVTTTGKYRVRQYLEPDYEKWKLGRYLFELRMQGYTYKEIEEKTGWLKLRETPSAGTNLDVLARMYSNFFTHKIYYGTLEYQDFTIENWIEPMVSKELWEAANNVAIKEHRGNWKRSPRAGKGTNFILAGLCECGLCQSPYYTKQTQRWRFYQCSAKQRGGWQACQNRLVNADGLEKAVVDHAMGYYLNGNTIRTITDEINRIVEDTDGWERNIEQVENQHRDLVKQIRNLTNLANLTGDITEIAAQVRVLEQQRVDTDRQLRELQTARPVSRIRIEDGIVEDRLGLLTKELARPGKEKAVLNQIIRRVVLWPQLAKISYKLPVDVAFSDNFPLARYRQIATSSAAKKPKKGW